MACLPSEAEEDQCQENITSDGTDT